jgi:hypothetical protein
MSTAALRNRLGVASIAMAELEDTPPAVAHSLV